MTRGPYSSLSSPFSPTAKQNGWQTSTPDGFGGRLPAHGALLTASCDRVKEECEPECCLEPDPGTCEAIYVRYYFDREDEKCRSFTYGGCEGVVPFEKKAECERACEDRPCDCAEDGGAQ